MPRMCVVWGCKSNYRPPKSDNIHVDHVTVFKLPGNTEDRERWIKNIPRTNMPSGCNTVVCVKHWPDNYPRKVVAGGSSRPINPPTVFNNVPQSQIPTPVSLPRLTKRSISAVRNVQPCQKKQHVQQVTVDCSEIHKRVHSEIAPRQVISYIHNETIHLQSVDFSAQAVPKFILKINADLTYEAYHAGVKCYVSTLTSASMRITHLTDWGHIIECIRFLDHMEISHKKSVLLDTMDSMSHITHIGEKVYSVSTMLRSFDYFATSRTTYNKFRKDFQLPSISTLTKLTSKASSLPDLDYIVKVLDSLPANQKKCIILVDEIHVKPCLLYHGGELFGRARNNPSELASSVLAVMIVCMFGGPKFIAKVIPVKKVSAEFQFNIIKDVIKVITSSHGKVISIINDNNRVNQHFMSMFSTEINKPWVTVATENVPENIYLLSDFVHFFKCIRNNWFTEPMQEILYFHPDSNTSQVAKWSDIIELYKLDRDKCIKLSTLTSVSVTPKPIERQNVSTMLKVFSDETVTALRTHPELDHSTVEPTAKFIELWVEVWKILNVKQPYTDRRLRDPRRAELRDDVGTKERLNTLLKMAIMVERMDCKNGKLHL